MSSQIAFRCMINLISSQPLLSGNIFLKRPSSTKQHHLITLEIPFPRTKCLDAEANDILHNIKRRLGNSGLRAIKKKRLCGAS